MDNHFITYEQPLNEQMRLNLRIEQLFKQLNHHLQQQDQQSSHLALETLIHILHVTDRQDLKTKLSQTLSQQMHGLTQLEESPQVDQEKLQSLLHRLDCILDVLNHGGRGKIAEPLRENPFIKNLHQHLLNNNAASAPITSPAYLLWLHQPVEQRQQDLQAWSDALRIIEESVGNILNLMRHSSNSESVTANNTFYQQALDKNLTCHMVRITLPVDYGIYPRTSIGKHRLSIRFESLQLAQTTEENKEKIEGEFPFKLQCCYL